MTGWLRLPWTGETDTDPDDGAPAVDVEAVTVDLGDTRALDGVSLAVEAGEFVGLLGPNGAGKTTLLGTITGTLSPTAGTVRLAGTDVEGLPSRAASRRVAAVPQDPTLAFSFDVREVVAMGRTPYHSRVGGRDRADAAAVDRALDRTDTAALADRAVDEVSGGERRRVLLARALAQETPVLLLDEPTASLDVNHQVRTLELVADLAAEGKAVVAAIHDLNLAARYCDRLVVLADGSLLEAGPPEEVLTEDTVAAAFGTRAAVAHHPVTGAPSVTALPSRAIPDAEHAVHVVGGGPTAAGLLYELSAAGFEVSAGALNRGDTALETARALDLGAVTHPPATPVDEETAAAVRTRVAEADVAVVADAAITEGTLPNLAAARSADAVVVVERRPVAERDAAGGEPRAVYDALRNRGTVVDPDDAVAAVADLAARPAGSDPPTSAEPPRQSGN